MRNLTSGHCHNWTTRYFPSAHLGIKSISTIIQTRTDPSCILRQLISGSGPYQLLSKLERTHPASFVSSSRGQNEPILHPSSAHLGVRSISTVIQTRTNPSCILRQLISGSSPFQLLSKLDRTHPASFVSSSRGQNEPILHPSSAHLGVRSISTVIQTRTNPSCILRQLISGSGPSQLLSKLERTHPASFVSSSRGQNEPILHPSSAHLGVRTISTVIQTRTNPSCILRQLISGSSPSQLLSKLERTHPASFVSSSRGQNGPILHPSSAHLGVRSISTVIQTRTNPSCILRQLISGQSPSQLLTKLERTHPASFVSSSRGSSISTVIQTRTDPSCILCQLISGTNPSCILRQLISGSSPSQLLSKLERTHPASFVSSSRGQNEPILHPSSAHLGVRSISTVIQTRTNPSCILRQLISGSSPSQLLSKLERTHPAFFVSSSRERTHPASFVSSSRGSSISTVIQTRTDPSCILCQLISGTNPSCILRQLISGQSPSQLLTKLERTHPASFVSSSRGSSISTVIQTRTDPSCILCQLISGTNPSCILRQLISGSSPSQLLSKLERTHPASFVSSSRGQNEPILHSSSAHLGVNSISTVIQTRTNPSCIFRQLISGSIPSQLLSKLERTHPASFVSSSRGSSISTVIQTRTDPSCILCQLISGTNPSCILRQLISGQSPSQLLTKLERTHPASFFVSSSRGRPSQLLSKLERIHPASFVSSSRGQNEPILHPSSAHLGVRSISTVIQTRTNPSCILRQLISGSGPSQLLSKLERTHPATAAAHALTWSTRETNPWVSNAGLPGKSFLTRCDVPCPEGYRCEVRQQELSTGDLLLSSPYMWAMATDFCGGCPSGQVCIDCGIRCWTPPCPSFKCVVTQVNMCGGCPAGHTCQVSNPPCRAPPICDRARCIHPTCPPEARCIPQPKRSRLVKL
ncbi:hypothetical protein Btru_030019 [Bulinus truncatus]|nr:hypothetical protein Btru_030019 [Bulinus truncatus]